MDKRTLQQKLNQPYDTKNWKEIVQYVFPNVQLLGSPRIITVNNEKVESFSQLGNVRLNDGKNLALFELTLKPHVNILRNRVELNNLVSRYIDQEQTHGVLSVFEQGQDDYRFTFSARATEFDEEAGDFRVSRTDTKRYTYVLGKNESCKTPAERFFSLAEKKDDADIKAIQDAFSVEKLSKEFFKGYKEHYLNFVQYINGKRPRKVNNKWEDQVIHQPHAMYRYIFNGQDKAVRDFVKLMLGRLVFIHFVQKKRWLGVPAGEESWYGGDPNFLCNAFQQFEHKGLFYSQFLEPLFNDALNKPGRPNDIFSVTGTRIPYLNGGLFEKGEVDTSSVDFPAELFESLLEFFGQYNFTIDESDPSEREVGIDPEMLGHIFENLLEDNKDKGAFYTPKEIVHYMCQESLEEYLKTYLEEKYLWPKDEENSNSMEQALEAFIKRKEAGELIDIEKVIATALRDVKICDPAIGSGAFPMGLLNEIYHCMFTLYHASPDVVGDVWGMESWEADTVKKNIIQNSIYGVDIEKGAVDIARLRFWLSLLIEEEIPNPLPNLDYKIVVGNSLVSKLGDEVIDIDWSLNETSQGFFGNEFEIRKIELLKKISREQREFFNPESDKKKLADDIRKLKIDLLINQLELMVNTKGIETLQNSELADKRAKKSRLGQTKLFLKTQGWKNSINHLKKLRDKPDQLLQFFDWKLDFPEVLNELINNNAGFDIIIANPPYIKEYTNKKAFDGFRNSPYYKGKMDIWYGFACKALDMLKPKGVECFIAQNNWITSAGASILREKVLGVSEIKLFTDFGNYKVFETAGIQTMIFILQKSQPKKSYHLKCSVLKEDKITKGDLLKFLNFSIEDSFSEKFNFEIDPVNYQGKPFTFNNEIASVVLEKIKNKGNFFFTSTEVAQGIVFPQDFVNNKSKSKLGNTVEVGDGIFALNDSELKSLNLTISESSIIKPFYTTNELDRYYACPYNKLWIIYTGSEFNDPKKMDLYPSLKSHLDKFMDVITSDNKPYGLHRAREERFFIGESVIALRKCSERPSFTYTNFPSYVSATFFIIQSSRFNLKFLTGLLNSKLIAYWLKKKGKMQGNNYQIDKEPLLAIPLVQPDMKTNKIFENYVNQIIEKKSKNVETDLLEQQIDNLVYRLYDLTYDEVKVIDPEFSLSREEYENITLEG